jgi:uncharacterized LabA/DUF88 family protein
VIEYAPQVDRVILLSGDGDFDLLLEKVSSHYGVMTEVYGVRGLTAPALIKAADSFVAIGEGLLM